MSKIIACLEGNPVIAAVEDNKWTKALESPVQVVFYMSANLRTIRQRVLQAHEAGKYVMVHLDLAEGIGKDRVGIIAEVCTDLAAFNVNVLDIRQSVMQGYFTMMMVVETEKATVSLAELAQRTEEKGKEMGLSIRLQREEIFQAMHRV